MTRDTKLPATIRADQVVLPAPDEITRLRRFTEARIGLGRAGSGLPTAAHLRFGLDHARARDAVWSGIDAGALVDALHGRGLNSCHVSSMARDRAEYLRRPDLGRRLSAEGAAALGALPPPAPGAEVVLMLGDGLSAAAVMLNGLALIDALLPRLAAARIGVMAGVVATQARVALGDPVGAILGARFAIVLIGFAACLVVVMYGGMGFMLYQGSRERARGVGVGARANRRREPERPRRRAQTTSKTRTSGRTEAPTGPARRARAESSRSLERERVGRSLIAAGLLRGTTVVRSARARGGSGGGPAPGPRAE